MTHIANMLKLVGVPPAEADARAQAVLTIETALANASISRVAGRNPRLTHHKLTLAEFEALTPHFDFSAYIKVRETPFVNENFDFYSRSLTAAKCA